MVHYKHSTCFPPKYINITFQKGGNETEDGDSRDTGEFVEYEWAGQTRIRATSLMEGGFGGEKNNN